MNKAKITVNKRTQLTWHANMTIQDVIHTMNYTFPHIIITLNGALVRHDMYQETMVPQDADVRIVHLIAGG